MPTGKDGLFELKLRKKLLSQQLSVVDDKFDRLNRIMDKKLTIKGGRSFSKKSTPLETAKRSFRNTSEPEPKKLMVPQTTIPGSKIDLVRKRNVIRRHNEMERRKPKPKAKMEKADPFAINTNVPTSLLPRRYTRGELPCTVEHRSSGLALSWMCPLHNLDYEHYLPIFMDGAPFTPSSPGKVSTSSSKTQQVTAIGFWTYSLSTKRSDVVLAVVNIIKQLCTVHPAVGPRLIPHYRQILGILNLFYCKGGKNLGDAMDYKQFNSDDLVVPIAEVLEMMERTGGPNAFVNIKFMVPTYTSAFAN
ncbi:hypothetical protein TL16_g11157 [Triparma laevis f. inornata]|uniref:Uncharacterized protein n=1 Tax=Triparma laevis f. inornata TaxID=1714386 RepID=A0A9W7BK17_9STRA|nr:hypothetical protein TL16_g11157 [Triparma laevis f. inornata]